MGKQKKPDPAIVIDVGPDLLASEIVSVAQSAKKLLNSRLERRAVLVLLKDISGVSMATIEKVLDSAARLDTFVKKEKTS